MTEKKLLVERYVLQTNTNTNGRVESCDTGQPTSHHEKQMLHNFTESTKQTPTKTDVWFTSRHIKCWHSAKNTLSPTLDVQSLNKTHRTKHRQQFLEETGLSNLMCVPTTCFLFRDADKTKNHKRGANTNAVAKQPTNSQTHTQNTQRANGTTYDEPLECGPRSRNLA